MHVGPHKGTHICGQVWEEGTADVGSQVDINTIHVHMLAMVFNQRRGD